MSHPLTILVVDDDIDNAQSLGELFEMEGHAVTVVHSGEAAIAAFTERNFDVAFMDVMMPGKNGVESFLEIKKLKPTAHVYMMTGYSVEQLLQQAMQNGAMGVLNKPFDIERILALLDEVKNGGILLVARETANFGAELRRMISTSGIACDLARTGSEAMSKAQGGGGVLILDLHLPLIDGIGVYSDMKRAGRSLPVIIVTDAGDDACDTYGALADVKVSGILNKPFDPSRLLGQLEQLAA